MSSNTVLLILLAALVAVAIVWAAVDDARWFRWSRRKLKRRGRITAPAPTFQPDRCGWWS